MSAFTPLCKVWHEQVKEFFTQLHGHQSKTLAMFVLGAIKAKSIVLPRVAEALLAESEAKAPSIERRLERFLSNEKIETEQTWDELLGQVLPYFRKAPLRLVIDLTAYEEHAQVIYLGLLQHSRVLPLVWKVMPGQQKWDQGLWECVGELFKRLAPHIAETECTIIGDSAFGCFAMVSLCVSYGWHYLFRICAEHTCEHWSAQGRLLPTCRVSELVSERGRALLQAYSFVAGGSNRDQSECVLGQKRRGGLTRHAPICQLAASVSPTIVGAGESWRPSKISKAEDGIGKRAMFVAKTRVDRMLLVLFLMVWWLAHLAASCIHNGHRDRYDRHDRRDKGIFRIGRLYLFDLERRASQECDLKNCLLFRRSPTGWLFSLRF